MRASNSACGYANSCLLLPMDKSSTSHSPMPCGAAYEDETRKAAECALMAQSGHSNRAPQCLLLGVKRTFPQLTTMSIIDAADKACRRGTVVFRAKLATIRHDCCLAH